MGEANQFDTQAPAVRLEVVPMALINEPDLPVRSQMADDAMAELVESLRAHGLLQPIAVKPVERGRFEIIYGHRRYVAARTLRWPEIRALVMPDGTVSTVAARVQENFGREDVNAADLAIFLADLQERDGLDLEGLMRVTGLKEGIINERFMLLRGDPAILEAVRQGSISFAVARELNRLRDESLRKEYLGHATSSGWSARETRRWVEQANRIIGQPTVPSAPAETAPAAQEQQDPSTRCHLCGGDKDPYHMSWYLFHRYCMEHIDKAIAGAAAEGK